MSNKYRVENKSNVHCSGRKTTFQLLELNNDAYVHIGNFMANGWNLTDDQCVADYIAAHKTRDDECPVCHDDAFIECNHCS